MSIYFLGVIVSCWIQDGNGNGYTITPLSNSPGLYYEKIGEVSLTNNNWEFVTSINYTGYLMFYQYLHKQAEKLYGFCRAVDVPVCFEKLEMLQSKLDTIDEEDEKMITFLGYRKPRRSKRFWGAIGSFIGGLFGFGGGGGGGQPDMSKYDNAISDLQHGQMELNNKLNSYVTAFMVDSERKKYQIEWLEKTQGEIKDKLSSVESEFKKDSADKQNQINNLNNMLTETRDKLEKHAEIQRKILADVNKIEQKLDSVDKNIKDLYEKVGNNSKKIDELALEVRMNELIFDFNFLMDRFLREQSKLFNSIEKANKGRQGEFDPNILTPLHLIEMLQGIIPHLKENEKFPFYPNVENAHNLYNLITPTVKLSSNYNLLFILKMPIVHVKKYNFFKMTSVPVHVREGLYTFVLPQQPFLLIDQLEQNYMLLPLEHFKDTCTSISNVIYICKQSQFINPVHESTDCEVNLFTSRVLPNTCDTRLMHLNNIMFLQLQKKNCWIFIAPMSPKDITVSCEDRRTILPLRGTGFVHFNETCDILIDDYPLTSLFEYTKPVLSNYSSAVNILDYIVVPPITKLSTKNQKLSILPFDFKALNDISIPIDTIDISSTSLYWLFVIPIVVLCGLIFLAYKMKFNFNNCRIRHFTRNDKKSNEEELTVEHLRRNVKLNEFVEERREERRERYVVFFSKINM